jgi:hypothetical protein
LLEHYPLAVEHVNDSGEDLYLMWLVLPGPVFAEAWRPVSGGSWELDDDVTLNKLGAAVPLPRRGSLFGYVSAQKITAVIAFYHDGDRPSFAVMPHAGDDRDSWPPFTYEPVLGPWFWNAYQLGRIVNLGPMVATHPETVFWAGTAESLGSNCCAVARDILTDQGAVLRSGDYVCWQPLADGVSPPALSDLLLAPDLTDLSAFAGAHPEPRPCHEQEPVQGLEPESAQEQEPVPVQEPERGPEPEPEQEHEQERIPEPAQEPDQCDVARMKTDRTYWIAYRTRGDGADRESGEGVFVYHGQVDGWDRHQFVPVSGGDAIYLSKDEITDAYAQETS